MDDLENKIQNFLHGISLKTKQQTANCGDGYHASFYRIASGYCPSCGNHGLDTGTIQVPTEEAKRAKELLESFNKYTEKTKLVIEAAKEVYTYVNELIMDSDNDFPELQQYTNDIDYLGETIANYLGGNYEKEGTDLGAEASPEQETQREAESGESSSEVEPRTGEKEMIAKLVLNKDEVGEALRLYCGKRFGLQLEQDVEWSYAPKNLGEGVISVVANIGERKEKTTRESP